VKGRTIFGALFLTIRCGARRKRLHQDLLLHPGKTGWRRVPAGKYALYTIPGESEWTVIIHKDTNASIFNYNATNDLVRFKVAPVTLSDTFIETFTIEFNRLRDESAVLTLVWDKTVVPIKLEVDVASKLVPQIEAAMASPDKKQAGFISRPPRFTSTTV